MKALTRIFLLLSLTLLAAPVLAAEDTSKTPEPAKASEPAAAPAPAPTTQALPAVKPAFEKSQLVGSWVGHKLVDIFSTDETIDEFGADFLEGGDLVATYVTDREDLYLKLKIMGKWRLENDSLIEKGVTVSEIELVSDKKIMKKDLDAMKAEQKKKIEQDPEFSKESADKILFIEAGFMVTKSDKGELMVFKKK
jgi:hypothetical protein